MVFFCLVFLIELIVRYTRIILPKREVVTAKWRKEHDIENKQVSIFLRLSLLIQVIDYTHTASPFSCCRL